MGKPGWSNVQSLLPEHIGQLEGTWGSETSQYPQEEKITYDSVSSGERKRKRPNLKRVKPAGVAFWVLWDQFDHSAEWSKSQKLLK